MHPSKICQRTRTYHDPLHGAITLDGCDPVESLLIELIDTAAFQRLRRVRQLGPASLTFHGAESSRFTHSLGVMAVARLAFDRLAKTWYELLPYRATVLCAALLHDIGHGPFSHTAEKIFDSHHERWTLRVLEQDDEIRSLLDQASPQLWSELVKVYTHQHELPLVWQLVSSQLDCDRIDYLMRDSYFTGASYGHLDLDRILLALEYDPNSQQLVVAHKGLAAIEHYLVVRYFMHAQIYNHPKNLSVTWMLEQIFSRARVLLAQMPTFPVDDIVKAWLQTPIDTLSLDQYLAADDTVFGYHVQRWQRCQDPLLADLCRRVVNRRLFKTLDLSRYSQWARIEILKTVRQYLTTTGLAADAYAGIKQVSSYGYTLYQRGIKLRTEAGLEDISQLSPLVKTLNEPYERSWLLYPVEIKAQVPALIEAALAAVTPAG